MPEIHQKRTDGAPGYVSLRRAANQLSLPYGPFRRAVSEGHLPSIKIGKRYLVRIEQISKQLEQLSNQSSVGGGHDE